MIAFRCAGTVNAAALRVAALSLSLFTLSCDRSSAPPPVVLGAILPLTGDLAPYGKSGREGIELAVAEYVARRDLPSVRLVVEDDKGDVRVGITAVNELIARNQVKIIVGAMASGVTLGIAPVVERNRVVLVSPTSTASDVTAAGDYVFRVCVSDAFEGPEMARFLATQHAGTRIAVAYINNAYGAGLKKDFMREAGTQGLLVVAEEPYPPDLSDFRPLVLKLQRANIGVLYLIGQKEQVVLLRAARQLKFHPRVAGTTMLEDPDIVRGFGSFLDGTVYTYRSYNPTDSARASVKRFVQQYIARFGREPDFYAASSYDAARVALDALSHAPYVSDSLKAYLYGLREFDGVTGSITFDKNGDVLQAFRIKQIMSGKFTYLPETSQRPPAKAETPGVQAPRPNRP